MSHRKTKPVPEIALSPMVIGREAPIIQSLLSATNHGILMTDLQGTDILCNTRFGELFEVEPSRVVLSTREEVRQLAVSKVKDPEAFMKVLERVYDEPQFEFEDEIELTFDPPRILRRYTGPVYAQDGDIIGRVWTFQDITVTKQLQLQILTYADRLEEQYRIQASDLHETTVALTALTSIASGFTKSNELSELHRTIVQLAANLPGWDSAALVQLNRKGEVTIVSWSNNCIAEQIFPKGSDWSEFLQGENERSVPGKTTVSFRATGERRFSRLLKAKSVARALLFCSDGFMGIIAVGNSSGASEFSSRRRVQFTALADQAALSIDAHVLHRDLKEAYEDLRAAQEQVIQSAKLGAVGTLAASIAHDIRNILTPLQLDLATAGDDESILSIRTHVDRLSALTHQLLALARPRDLVTAEVDLATLIRQLVPLIMPQATVGGVEVEVTSEPQSFWILGDKNRLEHLFINLLLNALNSMASNGGKLTANLMKCGKYIEVKIEDTGVGMTDIVRDRIFEPFFTTRVNGSGLGLFSARKIAEEHGGRISVQSEFGKGTCFSIQLPAIQTD